MNEEGMIADCRTNVTVAFVHLADYFYRYNVVGDNLPALGSKVQLFARMWGMWYVYCVPNV